MTTSFPFLRDWMGRAPEAHPLRAYFDRADESASIDSGTSAIVMAFENIIEALETAKPEPASQRAPRLPHCRDHR